MISTQGLTKTFGARTVLTDVCVDFPAASITAVVGPNGSGKTTMMKILLGLVTPTKGSFTVLGKSGVNNAASRKAMGYMAQVAHYPENLTASEVIEMVRSLRENQPAMDIDSLVRGFELGTHMSKPMRALSGGTRQKVGAVIALMFEPKILLLDEPTAGLDPISADQLKERMIAARAAGTAVIVSSHLLSELQGVADRVVYLHEGKVLHNGSTELLMQRTGTTTLSDAVLTLMKQGTSA